MRHISGYSLLAVMVLAISSGCSSYRASGGDAEASQQQLQQDASVAIERFKQRDPSMERFFDNARGYAVFPRVGKGGAGIGGARGHGVVYEQGQPVGRSTLTQATIGVQLGGQVFRQIIFFEDAATLDRFKQGNMEFSAQASAVAAAEGAAASADFVQGVAVFTMPETGLMFEAAIGGQKFSYTPK